MTRKWIAAASHALWIVRSSSAGPRRRPTSLVIENLEFRLSLSVSHTVAPFVRSLGPTRALPFVKHGAERQVANDGPSLNLLVKHGSETVVVTADGGLTQDLTGRRVHVSLVAKGSALQTITLKKSVAPAWIQAMPGEDAIGTASMQKTEAKITFPVVIDGRASLSANVSSIGEMGKMGEI